MKDEAPDYLFVYGTLREGIHNPVKDRIIDDVEWIGQAEIKGELYDIGSYTGAIPANDHDSSSIKGEIIKLRSPGKVLKILDQYEGINPGRHTNSEYRRDRVLTSLPDGKEINAWVYWYNFPVKGKRRLL
jgi:gamma-glutamylcyclotransferase (GGCT)/AIG2-like uncharacterized protein YtfP